MLETLKQPYLHLLFILHEIIQSTLNEVASVLENEEFMKTSHVETLKKPSEIKQSNLDLTMMSEYYSSFDFQLSRMVTRKISMETFKTCLHYKTKTKRHTTIQI